MLRALHPDLASSASGPITLSREESNHLVKVRRAGPSTEIELLDGRGRRARARLVEAHPKAARLEILELVSCPPPGYALTLWQALPKGRGMEHIIQKATELGVTAIQPIFCDHGELRLAGPRLDGKEERWASAALEAIKQCGNPWAPEIRPALPLARALERDAEEATIKLVASLCPPVAPVRETLRAALADAFPRVAVAVGPEGDFSPAEYALLAGQGWHSVSLGPLVLRVETATCALLALTLDSIRSTV